MFLALASGFCLRGRSQTNLMVHLDAAAFKMSTTNLICDDSSKTIPFNQSAVKQGAAPALLGPDPKTPYFTVRFAMPVPPENTTNNFAALTGIDAGVFTHNHSPGLRNNAQWRCAGDLVQHAAG